MLADCMMFAAVAAGPVLKFYDTFTGVNGTLLTAHTPDVNTFPGGWVALNGTNTNSIINLNISKMSGYVSTGIDTGSTTTTYTISGLVTSGSSLGSGCIARAAVGLPTDTLPAGWIFGSKDYGETLAILESTSAQIIARATAVLSGAKNITVTWAGDTATLGASGVTLSYSCPTKGRYWGVSSVGGVNYVDIFKLEA